MPKRRNPYVSPVTSSKKKQKRSFVGGVGRVLKYGADKAIQASISGNPILEAGYSAAKSYVSRHSQTAAANTKVSHVPKRAGRNIMGKMAGKIKGKGRAVNRNAKGMSKYMLSQKGITTREEFRATDSHDGGNESRLIGHTSLPVRATYYNIFRALVKCIMLKAGAHIGSLEDAILGTGGSCAIRYYTNWQSTTLLTKDFTVGNNITWKQFTDGLADFFLNNFDEDPQVIRFVQIEFIPDASYNSNMYSRQCLSFNQTKIHINSKSQLKFQNQSAIYREAVLGEYEAQADDVNNVPLECHTYYCKGNQFIHQNRRKSATIGYGFLGFDETYIKNTPGAEPVPAYQILNCTGKDKYIVDPGHIKTSVISYKGTLPFLDVLRKLVRKQDQTGPGLKKWEFNDNAFIKSLGHARAIHCDRVVGSTDAVSAKVKLMVEIELTQQMAVIGKMNTSTDQYEVQN